MRGCACFFDLLAVLSALNGSVGGGRPGTALGWVAAGGPAVRVSGTATTGGVWEVIVCVASCAVQVEFEVVYGKERFVQKSRNYSVNFTW